MKDITWNREKTFWIVAAVSALAVLPFLGETIFYSKGEPREAIVAVSMLQSGNWILPVNYGTDIAYKPPFLYWCIAAVSWLFGGEVSEYTARFPSAAAFLAMQLVFFRFVSRRKGTAVALLAAVLLLTSFEVHRAAVACRLDMLQVSLIVMSLCLLFRWDERGCRGLPWVAIALMACATLTKGPVGSIFPCVCIGIYQLLRGQRFVPVFFRLLGIGLLTLIPLAIWFWAAYRQGGDAFMNLMLEENTGRFFNKMSYPSHHNPVWYNFLTIIWGWIPWTLVLLVSLFGLKWRQMRLLPAAPTWKGRLRAGWQAFRSQEPVQLLAWVAILFIFIFYCIPESKRSVYLLPIYPFMAMLLAQYLLKQAEEGARVFRISAWIFALLGIVLTLVFAAVRLGLVPDSLWGTGRHAAENVAFVHALRDAAYSPVEWLLAALPALAAVLALAALRRKAAATALLGGVAACMYCIFLALDGVYQPTVLAVKSDKKLAECFARYVPEGPVYSYTDRLIRFYCANYYLHDRMRNFSLEQPEGEGYVALSAKVEDAFLAQYAGTYELTKAYATPYRSCDLRANVLIYKFKKK